MPPPESDSGGKPSEQSFHVLTRVRELVPGAVLIGGWATWVRDRRLGNHDIDMIVTDDELNAVGALSGDLSESTHLGSPKWRATIEGIHLDLYVPYLSRLGRRLRLRCEDLLGYAEVIDNWRVLSAPAHLATKLAALLDRADSLPGEKDRDECLALIGLNLATPGSLAQVLASTSEAPPRQVTDMTGEAFEYLHEHLAGRRSHRDLRDFAAKTREALAPRPGG